MKIKASPIILGAWSLFIFIVAGVNLFFFCEQARLISLVGFLSGLMAGFYYFLMLLMLLLRGRND